MLTALSAAMDAGEECPRGGNRIAFGIDENGDGILDGDETLETAVVCNGEPGPPGPMGEPGPRGKPGPVGASRTQDSLRDGGATVDGGATEPPRTEASGAYATAWGQDVVASGDYSVAMGYDATASGQGAVAMGYGTLANGEGTVAMGFGSAATESFSTALGYFASASGPRSTAAGYFTSATGNGATALGASTEATGYVATAMGLSTVANGQVSTATGGYSEANGDYSTAIGYFAVADARASLAVGSYNVGGGSPELWVGTDPIFEVGNGTSDTEANNALTILKNGNTGINTFSPQHTLDVVGEVRVASSQENGSPQLLIANDHPTNDSVGIRLSSSSRTLDLRSSGDELALDFNDGDDPELRLDRHGNLVISGGLVADGNSFPDYVFESDYARMSLADVGAYIATHGHLPGVPSAEEAKRDGVDMTLMQKLLLQKVEELTLYAIAQEEALVSLRDEALRHQAEVSKLRGEWTTCQSKVATRDARGSEQRTIISSLGRRLGRLERMLAVPDPQSL